MVWLLTLLSPAYAQVEYAATLQVVYPEVEVLRANTETWLALTLGAQTTLGAGDRVRTGAAGRAFIIYEAQVEILVMPDSFYELESFEVNTTGTLVIHANVQGRIIQRAADSAAITDYQLQTSHAVIVEPASLFVVQTEPNQTTYVIVAQGEVQIEASDQSVRVQGGYGLRVDGISDEIVPLARPMRFSDLSVAADSCQGLVMADPESGVQVRTGPGEDYKAVGQFENGTTIPILGIAEERNRYLTPFKNGFGWVLVSGIRVNCDDLLVIPLSSVRPLGGVVNVQPFELELLESFFGLPEEDTWFYTYE